MGGVTRKVGQELGVVKKPTPSPIINKAIEDAVKAQQAKDQAVAGEREVAEDRSARRRARRGGRAMLSDARLNPEQGVSSTLGQAGM